MFVRPALDRMPPTETSLNRLRALTSGAGRAAALETSNDWSSDGPVPGLWVGRKRFFDSDNVISIRRRIHVRITVVAQVPGLG